MMLKDTVYYLLFTVQNMIACTTFISILNVNPFDTAVFSVRRHRCTGQRTHRRRADVIYRRHS